MLSVTTGEILSYAVCQRFLVKSLNVESRKLSLIVCLAICTLQSSLGKIDHRPCFGYGAAPVRISGWVSNSLVCTS